MATEGFTFDELAGPTAVRKPRTLVPADRTSKKRSPVVDTASYQTGTPQYTPESGDETSIIEQEIGRPLSQQERGQIAAGTFELKVPVKKAAEDGFSFEELAGPSAAAKPVTKHAPKEELGFFDTLGAVAKEQFGPTADAPGGSIVPKFIREPVAEAAGGMFDEVMGRIQGAPKPQQRTPAEVEFAVEQKMKVAPDWIRNNPERAAREREILRGRRDIRFTAPMSTQAEAAKLTAQEQAEIAQQVELDERLKDKPAWQRALGFFGNPVEAILKESLPAHIMQTLGRAPERERQRYEKVKQRMQQEAIVANPSAHPASSVEAAQAAIEQEDSKKDPTVSQSWGALKKAATEDPVKFGAQFARAFAADPEMILAPLGFGTKIATGVRTAVRGTESASKALKIADKILDAGTAGASLNLAIEGAAKMAAGQEFTSSEAAFSAGIGAVAGAVLAPFFMRGAKAKAGLKSGELSGDDLDNALRDVAAEDLIVEDVVNKTGDIDPTVRDRIEETLGIKNMSKTERDSWHKKRQAELRKTFADESQEADYLAFKAEERILRSQQLADEAAAREAPGEVAGPEAVSVENLSEPTAARTARFQDEFDRALEARDSAELNQAEDLAVREDQLREMQNKLDEQEVFEASLEGDIPAIKRAMNSVARRDAKMRTPKWQRGEADPKLLARVGAAGLFAGAGFAMGDEDQKLQTAFAAGLAGLLIPGGGRVLDRMRQSGVMSLDGSLPGLADLIREGKLKPKIERAEAVAAEADTIARARTGDPAAYKKLYEENFPRVQRFVKQFVREAGPKLGVDADDVAQDVFIAAFKNLDKFQGTSQFYTWLHSIARNQGLMAIREAQNLKGGGKFDIQSSTKPTVRDPFGESYDHDVFDELSGDDFEAVPETPENLAIRDEVRQQLVNAIEKLPENSREIFLLSRVEQVPGAEIAERLGISHDSVRKSLERSQDFITEQLKKDYSAKRQVAGAETRTGVTGEIPKRGRGRPRKETGEIDPRLLRVGAVAALGAGAGAFLNDQNKLQAAITGGALLPLLFAKGKRGTSVAGQIVKGADYTLGITSTRIKNISEAVWRRAIEHERVVLRDSHKHLTAVHPFLAKMQKLPKTTQDILARAILTGKAGVTERLLDVLGDVELKAGWKDVRSTLDSLGDQLVHLKRFKGKELDYFPRMVKDVEGLLKALGRERGSYVERILADAETKAIRSRGTGLSEMEKSLIINKMLSEESKASAQPGFAKSRVVEEITPELQKFYHTPAESLHSYIRSAVEDIERAKFFGQDLAVVTKDGKSYTNTDTSVGNMVNRLIAEGKIAPKDAEEVGSLLKSRFAGGERAPAEIIQHAKNLSYAGLLGNPMSAATQLGDVIIQAFTQDTRSTLSALVRKLTGKKIVGMKEFGLADHVAEEFVSTTSTAKFLKTVLGASLFRGVDAFGKDIALNAAILRYGKLAKTERGVAEITRRYGDALQPEELKTLVKDLQKGEVTDLVRSVAFAELSRTQPITRLEMPQAYLDNPNGRLLYQFKTFLLKQVDLARREGFNEIKKGTPRDIARGLKQLTQLGVVMGIAGTTTAKIKDFLLGRDVDLEGSDIPMNMLKTFGMSQYFLDQFAGVSKAEAAERRKGGEKTARAQKAEPLAAVGKMAIPPYKMFEEIVRGDPKAVRYIPLIGPHLYEQQKLAKEKK